MADSLEDKEKQELADKQGELSELQGDIETTADEGQKKAEETAAKSDSKRGKEEIAKDYGETTVSKGEEIAEKGYQKRFLCFGRNYSRKEAALDAVEKGNTLLEQVGTSVEISETIDKKAKETESANAGK